MPVVSMDGVVQVQPPGTVTDAKRAALGSGSVRVAVSLDVRMTGPSLTTVAEYVMLSPGLTVAAEVVRLLREIP